MQWSVAGHQHQKESFEKLLEKGILAHAYIFSGPQGVGKASFALDIAGELLGRAITQNPDAMTLAPGVSKETGKPIDISAEDVRALKVWAYQRPLYGTTKVVVIDQAERLSDTAANTLLKVIEEPPTYLYFFLITFVPGSLLETITSRCQQVAFAPLDDDAMQEALADVTIGSEEKRILRGVVAGRPGIARCYLQDKRLPEIVRAIQQLKYLCASGVAERLVISKSITEENTAPEIVSWWLSWAHGALAHNPALVPVVRGLLELSVALSESKYNQRLALDRFALEAPMMTL